MKSKQEKLSELMGSYWDLESEFTKIYEEKLNQGNLWFQLPLKNINLTEATLNLENHFTIINEHQKIRGKLNKPYLFQKEIYQIELGINQSKKLSQNFSVSWPKGSLAIKILLNFENLSFWQEVLKQKYVLLNLKRIKPLSGIPQLFQEEFLNSGEDYAAMLKQKILQQMKSLKNPKLQLHRLNLWNYSQLKKITPAILNNLSPQDFGIKDTLSLRKIWQDFHLNISNEKLTQEADPEVIQYQQRLNQLYLKLINHKIIMLPETPI